MITLYDYQQDAIESVKNCIAQGTKRVLVSSPTGTGKTVMMGALVNHYKNNGRVLVLSPSNTTLVNQTKNALKKDYEIDAYLIQGKKSCVKNNAIVSIASEPTLARKENLEIFPSNYFNTIVIDEAHHSLAKKYKGILEYFKNANLIGFTATIDGGCDGSLSDFYNQVAYDYSIEDAIRDGHLSGVKAKTIPLTVDLRNVKTNFCGDYQDASLSSTIRLYFDKISDVLVKECKDKHTVIYLPLVETAKEFCTLLNKKGLPSKEIDGTTTEAEKELIFKQFREGKIKAICNVNVLKEGWDEPCVDCIVPLRPTLKRSTYVQMVGRGLRLCPSTGKTHCTILDFLWLTAKHSLVINPAELICFGERNHEVLELMKDKLKKGEETDLLEANEEAENIWHNRKFAIEKSLVNQIACANEQNKVDDFYIDADDLSYLINEKKIRNYEEILEDEKLAPTEKQIECLKRNRINPQSVKTRGLAWLIINKLANRSKRSLATVSQMRMLTKCGFKYVADWSFDEANDIIGKICNDKTFLKSIKPATYLPKRLNDKKNKIEKTSKPSNATGHIYKKRHNVAIQFVKDNKLPFKR